MSHESALKKLAEVIVGVGGQPSIEFSNINQTHRNLQIVMQARAAALYSQIYAQFNGDTAMNYDSVQLSANASAAASTAAASQAQAQIGWCAAANAPANTADQLDVLIANYAGTTFQKTLRAIGGLKNGTGPTNLWDQIYLSWWHSTVPITSILLFAASGNFAQGSVCSLYGWL